MNNLHDKNLRKRIEELRSKLVKKDNYSEELSLCLPAQLCFHIYNLTERHKDFCSLFSLVHHSFFFFCFVLFCFILKPAKAEDTPYCVFWDFQERYESQFDIRIYLP